MIVRYEAQALMAVEPGWALAREGPPARSVGHVERAFPQSVRVWDGFHQVRIPRVQNQPGS